MSTIIPGHHTRVQSSPMRPGRKLMIWLWRGLLGLLAAIVILALAGAAYQAVATAIDTRSYPPPGQLIKVGDHRLHIHCMGDGSPTVILESAMPGASANWGWVQPDVARATRVCAYDRAGMGWSDPGPEPRDAHQIANELHALLENAGLDGPYILVGHSLGGLYARDYAAQYPETVAGMVLVDATHPDLWTHLPPELALPDEQTLAIFPPMAMIGVTRFYTPFPVDPDLPEQQRAELAALQPTVKTTTAIAAELRAIPATTEQVRAAGDLGDIPLLVLTAGDAYSQLSPELAAPAKQAWVALQDDLVTLSSNTVHVTITEATHESLVYKQGDAQSTSAAILQIIEAARTR